MKRTAAILLLCLFMLQVGIKSMVVAYYNTFDQQEARENCIYKELTICQGSCYITKKIKVITSGPVEKNQHTPFQLPLHAFKEAVCLSTATDFIVLPVETAIHLPFFYKRSLYDFSFSSGPFRPPIG